jgi:alkyl sulfatase BDS1-like metallo-beta-lactamase superfamily hydrolase
VAALAGGVDRLVERALELSASGEHRLAAHLVEMASLAQPDVDEVRSARAAVFGARASIERSTMAKGVYSWAQRESTPTE